MIERSSAYKAAITGDSRRMLLRAIIEIIDPDIVHGVGTSSGAMDFSKPEQLVDKEMQLSSDYVTLESNRWILGRGFNLVPASKKIPGQIGMVCKGVSGADRIFATPQWIEQPFTGVSILQACSVFFPDADLDGVPEDFTVEIRQGGTAYHTQTFTGNRASQVSVDGFTVYEPDAIRVTATKWSLPGRRMRAAEIRPGVYETWDGDIIASFDVAQQGDISCLSLPYGTCTLRMDNLDRRFEPRNKNGIFLSLEERQGIPVEIAVLLEDGKVEYKQVGVFYQYAGGWRTGDNGLTMQWDLVDIVGLVAERTFIPPESIPTNLAGWIAAVVAQLGSNFADLWHVDPNYSDLPLTCDKADVTGVSCGDVLRWACMATGTWPRADARTGYLTAEPLWNEGNELTLDNLESYPVMKANDDLAAIIFTLNDGNKTQYVVSGNSTSSSKTVSVANPFIKDATAALTAARLILAAYGGNRLETVGRGDPAGEIGDVDTVWLNESAATTGRRIMQSFGFQSGVLRGCRSTLLQADGSFLYQSRAAITQSGTWKAPAGVNTLRIILVGKGGDGIGGTDGSWEAPGIDGVNGAGGRVWAATVTINPEQEFAVQIGDNTVFGPYSSANGKVYEHGYTDVASGSSYGRTGVAVPLAGSGYGGKFGAGGVKGNRHREERTVYMDGNPVKVNRWVTDNEPGTGKPGVSGATGCVVVYWDKEGGT